MSIERTKALRDINSRLAAYDARQIERQFKKDAQSTKPHRQKHLEVSTNAAVDAQIADLEHSDPRRYRELLRLRAAARLRQIELEERLDDATSWGQVIEVVQEDGNWCPWWVEIYQQKGEK